MGVRFIRRARIARGKANDARAFAAEISTHWEETYGTKVTWGFEIGGNVGTLYWFSDHESLATMEAEMMSSMANEHTSKLLADAADLFEGITEDKLVVTM